MITAEQILKDKQRATFAGGLTMYSKPTVIEAMKEYAKEVAKEALKNASENALLVNKFGNDIGSFAFDENSNKIWINKQSILNEYNIPSL